MILELRSRAHQDFLEFTDQAQSALSRMGWREGILHLFVKHTTCGLTLNENADPDVLFDLKLRLDELCPWDHPQDRHMEGNSAAHLKSSLMGFSLSIPVREGRLELGTWQGLYLCEFDGPRNRKIDLKFLPAS